MKASKNYELFSLSYSYILYVYWFIYPDMLRSLRGFLMISLFFFRTYPATHQRILKISRSLIFTWCDLAISKSLYLENPAISNFSSSLFRARDNGTRLFLKRLEISRINNYKFITSCYAQLNK